MNEKESDFRGCECCLIGFVALLFWTGVIVALVIWLK